MRLERKAKEKGKETLAGPITPSSVPQEARYRERDMKDYMQ